MPSEKDHLTLANHNHDLLLELLPKIDRFADWVATVACYKALHVVEAVFARENPSAHGSDHSDRERRLKKTNRYRKIAEHYGPLVEASMAARYIGTGCPKFSAFMSPREVFDILIMHDLHQLETSAMKFLTSPCPLVTVASSALVFQGA